MQIDFDPAKNQINIATRGLGFKRASEFDFDTAIVAKDTRKAYPELRFVAVGFLNRRLHVLCFTPITGGLRVISFRKANAREAKNHDQTRSTD